MNHDRGMKETIVYCKGEYKVYKDCHSSIIVSL
jgi:hypothetical protein